jgi:hypothetical protein
MTGMGLVLVLVGAGPRATGLVERIAANGELLAGRSLTIHVTDPHPPGAGKVWRQDQSPLLLMNSRAGDITMFTDSSSTCAGPIRPGPTLHEWGRTAYATGLADPDLVREAGDLARDSFASRRLAGQYLQWCFRQAASGLPRTARLLVHRATAVGLRCGPRHVVTLSDGTRLDADVVILAQGDIGGELTAERQSHADFAAQAGGRYLPPGLGDGDLDKLPAGEQVIVAGLGLSFIDIVALLTEGRGGRFECRRGERLRYRPSGQEPVLQAGSRRGVPYLPKPVQRLAGLEPGQPHFCAAAQVRDILSTSATPAADLLACIVKELCWAYYRELFSGHPDLTTCSLASFAERYNNLAITDPMLKRVVEHAVPDARDRLDLGFLRPLAGLRFTGQEALDAWVRRWIDAAVVRSTSPRHSPYAALVLALVDLFEQHLAPVLSSPDTPTRGVGLAGLTRFTSFLSSGPPPQRLKQLVALSDAGVVRFLGAGLTVGHDQERCLFSASSHSLAAPVFAPHLVEARLPDTDVRSGADALLAGLGPTSRRLRADPATFQVLDGSGQPIPRLLAMGAFSSGGALGSLSRPCRDAVFFRQNDAVTRWLLQ